MKEKACLVFFFWFGYFANRILWHPPEPSVELQMLPTRQQVTDGIKLWTVTHQLVDALHLHLHTEKRKNSDLTNKCSFDGEGFPDGERFCTCAG